MKIQPKNEYAVGSWVKGVIESCKTKEQLNSAQRLKSLFCNSYCSKRVLSVEIDNYYEKKWKEIFQNEK
jgi:hypothetical protein